jgi:hypothetical protein
VEVVDGDTLFVGETEVRLKGVDAMEEWTAEGKHATAVMHGLALAAETVICDLTGETTRDREVGLPPPPRRARPQPPNHQARRSTGPRYDARYLPDETPDARDRLQQAHYCVPRETVAPGPRSSVAICAERWREHKAKPDHVDPGRVIVRRLGTSSASRTAPTSAEPDALGTLRPPAPR